MFFRKYEKRLGKKEILMKRFVICLLIASILLLISCKDETKASTATPENESWQGTATDGSSYEPGPGVDISVYSLDELDNMRKMVSSSNEEEWDDYMKSVSHGKAKKEDFVYFLSLVDSIPYVRTIDGDITWLSYSSGQSVDTGKSYKVLYILTESPSGVWIRYEYVLSETNVSSRIEEVVRQKENESLITSPILSKDGKVTIVTETRHDHPSEPGVVILWNANVNGIYTVIYYYTPDADQVDASELFGKLSVGRIDTAIEE